MRETDFNCKLRTDAQAVNVVLNELLAGLDVGDAVLKDALRYTLTASGKRIRSVLVLWCCELVAGRVNRDAEIAAAAVEMVHTYSLVHDDLPAMDDDDLRRGIPTCHKAFDEATAILTGDALLTLAFEVLAERIAEPKTAVRLIGRLAHDAGACGMVAGQMADLRAENAVCDRELLEHIHTYKTARMFRAAAAMGAVCGGADDEALKRLSEYGLKIGLGFQIADDILDISASSEQLGKTAGKDQKACKCTYPAVVGMEEARHLERELAEQAIAVLEPFGPKAKLLRRLASALLERTK